MAALMAAPDPTETYGPAEVANNCLRSTRSLAQTMAYVVDRGVPVAWAGDWMGQGRGVAPRRGHSVEATDWCAGRRREQAAQGGRVSPDLTRYTTPREREAAYFATRGLAHWGLLEAFHEDLEAIGLPRRYREPFTDHAAENVLRMWERAEALAGACPAGLLACAGGTAR